MRASKNVNQFETRHFDKTCQILIYKCHTIIKCHIDITPFIEPFNEWSYIYMAFYNSITKKSIFGLTSAFF